MDEIIFMLYSIGFWILLCITIADKNTISELKNQIQHHPENEKLLKEKLEKEIKLLNIKINEDFRKANMILKVPRIYLGNIVRSFKSAYVYLEMKDVSTLKISDGQVSSELRTEITVKR